ncbi:hypothetical protein [Polaromonas glacialis]|uniref:hypothetical protein n=1 Tax=Polaromonas glacialis TaxID=866564 RepID=UPI001E57BDC7|nr:hypothetical protein [Polaromonas glacialis]
MYDIEFKLAAWKRLRNEDLSCRQGTAVFDICNFNLIGVWVRAYCREEVDGLVCHGVTRYKTIKKEPSVKAISQLRDDAIQTRQELLEDNINQE